MYLCRVGGVWVQLLRGQEAHTRVILVLRECIWSVPVVSLVLLASKISAPWVFLRVGWSNPLVQPWVIAARFLAWNKEAELKPTTFSSLLPFLSLVSCLFSSLDPQQYSTP